MGILAALAEWASAGDKTEPSASFISSGWEQLQRPSRQKWNWFTANRDQRLNRLRDLDEARGPMPGNASLANLCAGLPTVQWEAPGISPNYVDTEETIRDSCLGIDQNTGDAVIYVLHGDSDISPLGGVWDYSTPALGTALSLSYGATVDTVCAICSDGTYLYVAWYETAGDLQVSRFSQGSSSWSLDWTFDTNVANSTGFADGVKMCIADASTLGIIIPTTTTAPYRLTVGTLTTDGVSFYTGTPSANRYIFFQCSKIISDGVYLYAIGYTGSDPYDFDLCKFQISDPTTYVCVSIATSIASTNWEQYPTGLSLAVGDVILTCPDGTVYCSSGASTVDLGSLNMTFYDGGGGDYGTILDTDGTNLWAFQVQEDYTTTDCVYRIFKMQRSALNWYVRATTLEFHSLMIRRPSALDAVESNKTPGRMIFDGQALWLILYNGHIYRICAPDGR